MHRATIAVEISRETRVGIAARGKRRREALDRVGSSRLFD